MKKQFNLELDNCAHEMYSIQAVNNFVLTQLGDREKMLANELHIDNIQDFITMMLIPVYSTNSGASYVVTKLKNQSFDCLKYIVDDYEIIKRKE